MIDFNINIVLNNRHNNLNYLIVSHAGSMRNKYVSTIHDTKIRQVTPQKCR